MFGKRVHQRIVHSIPFSVCLANWFITEIRLKKSFWKFIAALIIIYALFLYYFWKTKNLVQYPFTDFGKLGWRAFTNILGIGLGAIGFYLIFFEIESTILKREERKDNKKDYQDETELRRRGISQEF